MQEKLPTHGASYGSGTVHTVRKLLSLAGIKVSDSNAYRDCSDEMLDFKIVSGDFYELPEPQTGFFRFKNSVNLVGLSHITNILPELEHMDIKHKDSLPYYAEGLQAVRSALDSDPESVCVEGGPCLFGENEVIVSVKLQDGTSCSFDYSTGKKYDKQDEDEELASFLADNASRVSEISFQNHKTGLTYQEYLCVLFPFAIAKALNTALVFTLPDMSYRKYLLSAIEPLPKALQDKTLEDFNAILWKIADMYLELADRMQSKFQIKRLTSVHDRNQEAIKLFESSRRRYIERRKILRGITDHPAKLESIKDYISMPALPYYIYGARTMLEINSMDEVDSYRKCRRAHRSEALSFACLLFPEMLSDDGEHTLYCAPLEYKNYGAEE